MREESDVAERRSTGSTSRVRTRWWWFKAAKARGQGVPMSPLSPLLAWSLTLVRAPLCRAGWLIGRSHPREGLSTTPRPFNGSGGADLAGGLAHAAGSPWRRRAVAHKGRAGRPACERASKAGSSPQPPTDSSSHPPWAITSTSQEGLLSSRAEGPPRSASSASLSSPVQAGRLSET